MRYLRFLLEILNKNRISWTLFKFVLSSDAVKVWAANLNRKLININR